MIYDYETDETYFSSRSEEMEYQEYMAHRIMCLRCGDYKPEVAGFRLVDGAFCCNDCKPEVLQKGLIALCLYCGDYFWVKVGDTAAISCPACKQQIAMHAEFPVA